MHWFGGPVPIFRMHPGVWFLIHFIGIGHFMQIGRCHFLKGKEVSAAETEGGRKGVRIDGSGKLVPWNG
jgi:hypothetical protein